MELLIVLAILAFIATLVAPRVIGYLGKSKHDIATTQIANVAMAVEYFFLDYGRYPTREEGLGILVTRPEKDTVWDGPYLKDPSGLVDPWGKPYVYTPEADSDAFRLITLGRDGVEGGTGENADILRK